MKGRKEGRKKERKKENTMSEPIINSHVPVVCEIFCFRWEFDVQNVAVLCSSPNGLSGLFVDSRIAYSHNVVQRFVESKDPVKPCAEVERSEPVVQKLLPQRPFVQILFHRLPDGQTGARNDDRNECEKDANAERTPNGAVAWRHNTAKLDQWNNKKEKRNRQTNGMTKNNQIIK